MAVYGIKDNKSFEEVYTKDEIYTKDEVYNKNESNNLIENIPFSMADITFVGYTGIKMGFGVTENGVINTGLLLADKNMPHIIMSCHFKSENVQITNNTENPISIDGFIAISGSGGIKVDNTAFLIAPNASKTLSIGSSVGDSCVVFLQVLRWGPYT